MVRLLTTAVKSKNRRKHVPFTDAEKQLATDPHNLGFSNKKLRNTASDAVLNFPHLVLRFI